MEKLNNWNVLIVKSCNGPFSVWWWHTVKIASNERWSICIDLLDVLMKCLLWKYYLCLRSPHRICRPLGWLSSEWNITYVNILILFFLWNSLSTISVWILIQYLYEPNDVMFFRVFFFLFLLRQFVDEEEWVIETVNWIVRSTLLNRTKNDMQNCFVQSAWRVFHILWHLSMEILFEIRLIFTVEMMSPFNLVQVSGWM